MVSRHAQGQRPIRLICVVALGLAAAACGSSQATSGPLPAAHAARRAVGVPAQPPTVTGSRLGEDDNQATVRIKRGTIIPAPRFASNRVFMNAKDGFALILTSDGVIYPGATTTRGRTWEIAGPVFFTPTADGPNAVSTVTAIAPRTFVAFGAGNFVRVSTDGGRRWWQTELGDETAAVVAADRGLVAFAQQTIGNSLRAVTWVYRSTDGRHWQAIHNQVADQ
jgi:hypothetical protein